MSTTKQVRKVWHTFTKPLYWFYERSLLRAISQASLPKHIGIIMDGNRRFARTVGLDVRTGHNYGAGKAREVLDWCLDLGIKHVTIWGFSTENHSRKPEEVAHLHSLFAQQAKDLINDTRLHDNRVRVRVIGDIDSFPHETKEALRRMEEATQDYGGMHLNVALGYGGREEIVSAVRKLLLEQCHNKSLPRTNSRITL